MVAMITNFFDKLNKNVITGRNKIEEAVRKVLRNTKSSEDIIWQVRRRRVKNILQE